MERAMCKIVFNRGCVSQAPLKLAITDIDPDCDGFDSDLQYIFKDRKRRRCDRCPPKVAKKCDKEHCCMDPEYSGSC